MTLQQHVHLYNWLTKIYVQCVLHILNLINLHYLESITTEYYNNAEMFLLHQQRSVIATLW